VALSTFVGSSHLLLALIYFLLDPAHSVPVCPSFGDHPNDAEGRGRVVSDAERSEPRGAGPAGGPGSMGNPDAQDGVRRAVCEYA
jgi:hypothetical protein